MVGIIAVFIGQWITSAVTQKVLARRAAAKSRPQTSNGAPCSQTSRIVSKIATRIIPQKTRLLTERQASYKALIANGSIRPVPSAKWLSGQSVVCANGHRSAFGLFASLSGYGTFANLPDFNHLGSGWGWKVDKWAARLLWQRGAEGQTIRDRDPRNDGHLEMACPTCGVASYTFEEPSLRDYAMCTASADLFWLLCHPYHKKYLKCIACELRKSYWNALRSLD
ncbi:MAG: hypothetical protein ACRYFS_14995 [Janthinobacterium lividum]